MKKHLLKIFRPLLLEILVMEAEKIPDPRKKAVVLLFLHCLSKDLDISKETIFK